VSLLKHFTRIGENMLRKFNTLTSASTC